MQDFKTKNNRLIAKAEGEKEKREVKKAIIVV